MKFRILAFFLFFTCFHFKINGQNTYYDELTYQEIEKIIDESPSNKEEIWKMIRIYINKAKKENNQEALLFAYRYASTYSDYPQNLRYADSAISVVNTTKKRNLIANAFLNRGIVYMYEYQYEKALNDILISHQHALDIENDYILYKSKYLIGQNKVYLGLYEDALNELYECISFFKNNSNNSSLGKDYQTYYIYSLMSVIDINSKLGKHYDNYSLFNEAFSHLNKYSQHKQFLPYFISLQGTDSFYKKEYKIAIDKLTKALKLYSDQWDHITEIFYLGKSYWSLGKQNVAVKYFETIDKQYNKKNNLDPRFREAYEHLIEYNDSIKNRDLQLVYINKLMNLDKSYEKNYKYLFSTLHKQYDTKKLIAEKTKIENSLKNREIIISILILGTLFIISFSVYRIYRIKANYRKRFNELISNDNSSSENNFYLNDNTENMSIIIMDHNEEKLDIEKIEILEYENPENFKDHSYYTKIPGINPQVVENILDQLDNFEKNLDFLDNQISQKQLSEDFGTNSTYLSKIINIYKGKKFSNYVNDLRLDYILHLLKTDWKYLNKDIKELSQITGFNSTENFSDNFQRKFKIKPSYFIKLMKEKIEKN